jgi:hypothetical protein
MKCFGYSVKYLLEIRQSEQLPGFFTTQIVRMGNNSSKKSSGENGSRNKILSDSPFDAWMTLAGNSGAQGS